ncbi:MAG TPA: hypothetical protein VGK24_14725 [Candidatus Angelobacter sp.]
MLSKHKSIRNLALMALLCMAFSGAANAQNPTASGVINANLVNKNGISIQFDTNSSGVTLGAAGTSAATANFGAVSAFGPLSGGVTRPSVTAANYTVRTIFDVQVVQGGLASLTYTLTANLAAAAPIGLSYKVDAVTLSTASQTIQTNGGYNTDIAHNLDLVVSTAAPGAGGPAVGTPITTVINFTATAN